MSPSTQKPLFQFKDDVIDPAALEKKLRQQVIGIPPKAEWWPRYGVSAEDEDLSAEGADQLIKHHLQYARRLLNNEPDFAVGTAASSPVTRLPVIGPLWRLMRQQAHALVMYYLDRQRAHQAEINHHLLEAIAALGKENGRLRDLIGLDDAPSHER